MGNSRFRKYLYATSLVLGVLGGLFIVAASPFALNLLGKYRQNWTLLSNIGQTYGAISVLLAAIGIAGIVTTIMLQIRESQRARIDSIRTHHYELYRMAMEDSSLTEISHGISVNPLMERKYTIYINLQLQFWLMLWGLGSINEMTLHAYAADLFMTEPGRKYWERGGAARMKYATGARGEMRFLQIINEEYERHAAPAHDEERHQVRHSRIPAIIVGTTVVAIAISAGVAFRKLIRLPVAIGGLRNR